MQSGKRRGKGREEGGKKLKSQKQKGTKDLVEAT